MKRITVEKLKRQKRLKEKYYGKKRRRPMKENMAEGEVVKSYDGSITFNDFDGNDWYEEFSSFAKNLQDYIDRDGLEWTGEEIAEIFINAMR